MDHGPVSPRLSPGFVEVRRIDVGHRLELIRKLGAAQSNYENWPPPTGKNGLQDSQGVLTRRSGATTAPPPSPGRTPPVTADS